MSYISAIGTATPDHRFDQATLTEFMVNAMRAGAYEKRKIKTVFKASGIRYRYSVLDDFGKSGNFDVFPNDAAMPNPGTEARMTLYRKHALPLSIKAIDNLIQKLPQFSIKATTHLIVVSCTGMYAPGLDIDIIRHYNLSTSTERTCINFMGCYAAFNGIKTADAFCKSNNSAKVLVVCVELCSLHFQSSSTDDNILANALFSDGASAMLIEHEAQVQKRLKIEQFHNDLSTDGEGAMAWCVADHGFQMKLSSYVPELLAREIRQFVEKLLAKISKGKDDIRYYAFHPGGKKILEAIEQALCITREDNHFAYEVLGNYGNMSSPTVVFVLESIFSKLNGADDNAWILGAAFGPGLTLESMLLKAEIR